MLSAPSSPSVDRPSTGPEARTNRRAGTSAPRARRQARRDAGTRPTACVLDLNDAGLSAIRSLGRVGVPVVGLDYDRRNVGFASRYCTAKRCPHPLQQQHELVSYLRDEGEQLVEPGILFPASDDFLLLISRHRDVLQERWRIALPTAELVEAILNKRQQYELARSAGVPYPTTYLLGILNPM